MHVNKVQSNNPSLIQNYNTNFCSSSAIAAKELKTIWYKEYIMQKPISALPKIMLKHVKQWRDNLHFAKAIKKTQEEFGW